MTHTQVCAHAEMCTRTHVCTHKHVWSHMCTPVSTCMHERTHEHALTHTHEPPKRGTRESPGVCHLPEGSCLRGPRFCPDPSSIHTLRAACTLQKQRVVCDSLLRTSFLFSRTAPRKKEKENAHCAWKDRCLDRDFQHILVLASQRSSCRGWTD